MNSTRHAPAPDGDMLDVNMYCSHYSNQSQQDDVGRLESKESFWSESMAQTFKEYNMIESAPGGFVVMEQRTKLMETLPNVKAKVAAHINRAEREFSTMGQNLLHEAVQELVQARSHADKAKAVATRSGLPPDHPDFPRVQQIEDNLDKYMYEAVRLYKLAQTYRKDIERWRTDVEELGAQRPGLFSVFKNARRQNQLFEAVSNPPESGGVASASLRRPFAEPGSQHRSSLRPLGSARGASTTGSTSLATPSMSSRAPPMAMPPSAPLSARPPAPQQPDRVALDRPGMQVKLRTTLPLQDNPGTLPPVSSNANKQEQLSVRSQKLSGSVREEEAASLRQQLLCEARETQYKHEIRVLEEELKRVRQDVHSMRDKRARGVVRVGWLEEFFLLCMDDLRKEFLRRGHLTTARQLPTRSSVSGVSYVHPSNQISAAATASSRSSKQSQRDNVVEVLLRSEDLLAFLFEKLFPHRSAYYNIKRRQGAPKIAGSRSGAAGGQPPMQQCPSLPSYAAG